MRRIIIIAIAIFGLSVPAYSDELSADEQAVWDLEIARSEYVKSNDRESYRALYDDRFTGWPHRADRALDRLTMNEENFGAWIPRLHENPAEIYDYELDMHSVRSFGDMVVAIYAVRAFFRSAETGEIIREERNDRIIHSWYRRGDSWQIVTGMSALPKQQ